MSRPTFEASKTIFNLVPCDNEFEREFAQFLQDATDVESFAKLPEQFGFAIEYTDSATQPALLRAGLRRRRSATARTTSIETKGREDVDVAHKDRAATIWCENATLLTDVPWSYVKVPQVEFGKLQPTDFSDAVVAFGQLTW